VGKAKKNARLWSVWTSKAVDPVRKILHPY
jgi:hypothetical protein